MRADLLAVLSEEKEAMKASLRQLYAAVVDQGMETIRSTVDDVFIPSRDGL
jgi:hypothetical protein